MTDASKLSLRVYPDPILRLRAAPVGPITDSLRATADNMVQAMLESDGIGLAAPQVGLSIRLFVIQIDPPPKPDKNPAPPGPDGLPRLTHTNGLPIIYFDPVTFDPVGAVEPFEEGCLSLPDIRGNVLRPPLISVRALGRDGQPFTQHAAGLLARCIQHELDHLDGVLILDRMVQASRVKTRRAVKNLEDRYQPPQ